MEKFSPQIKYSFILHLYPHVLISFLHRINLIIHAYNHHFVPPSSHQYPCFSLPEIHLPGKALTLLEAYYLNAPPLWGIILSLAIVELPIVVQSMGINATKLYSMS